MTEIEQHQQVTPTGLQLPDHLTIDEWVEAGAAIVRTHLASMWWLGDWSRYADNFDSTDDAGRARKALADCGVAPAVLRAADAVARHFPPEDRRPKLVWTHHMVVAKVESQERQLTLLDMAEELGLNPSELIPAPAPPVEKVPPTVAEVKARWEPGGTAELTFVIVGGGTRRLTVTPDVVAMLERFITEWRDRT